MKPCRKARTRRCSLTLTYGSSAPRNSVSTSMNGRCARSTAGCRGPSTGASAARFCKAFSRARRSTAPSASSSATSRRRARTSPARSLGYDRVGLTGGLFDRADLVDALALALENRARFGRLIARDDDHHADPAIEHAPHLVLGHGPRSLQPREGLWARPGALADRRAGAGGKDARHIAHQPAARDVGEAFDRQGFEQLQYRLHVDARRLERVERRLAALENPADERKAVGVRPARGEAEQSIAGRDRAAVDDARLLHHADAEPGEVVFALRIHARHLGGLAADERAACDLAASGDAFDDGSGDGAIELSTSKVIQKKERLGALHEHIVHAHRHEVDAYGVVPPERECELELGADAVGARHQHGLAVILRDLAQRAEPADAGEHFRPQGAPGERLDGFHQAVA